MSRQQELSLAGSEGDTFAPEPNALTSSSSPLPPASSPSPPLRPRPPPAVHLVAGGLGGMCGAIVTAPFDLVKTRLQSSLFQTRATAGLSTTAGSVPTPRTGLRGLLWNFADTGLILRDVYRYEGPTALFKGLGPTLVGVMPGRSINFFVYGNGKRLYADQFNSGKENAAIHLSAAATAGIITAAVTNPIWVTKTQLQLLQQARPSSTSPVAPSSSAKRPTLPTPPQAVLPARSFSHSFRPLSSPPAALSLPRNPTSFSIMRAIWRQEGIAGFYRGLSASLLGVTEGVIQWGLYEQFKLLAKKGQPDGEEGGWRISLAAGSAKLIATMITYPHEVIRTRLRQPAPPGQTPKYVGLVQSFRLVLREEGARALYSGLSPHLMRVVPNAVTMFYVYEYLLRLSTKMETKKSPGDDVRVE